MARLAPPLGVYDYSRAPPCNLAPFYDTDQIDFEGFFPVQDKGMDDDDSEDYDEYAEFWLSPRMAYKLHAEALSKGEMLRNDQIYRSEVLKAGTAPPDLPPCVAPFLKKQWWMDAYIECFNRIGARLALGVTPRPNCTGEEMALHQLLAFVEEMDDDEFAGNSVDFMGIERLPETERDHDLEGFRDSCMEDEDVLMLYDAPSEFLTAVLPDTAFLHPAQWFFSFIAARVQDHMPPGA